MLKRVLFYFAAAIAVLLAGCANDQAFLKAQADAATAASQARVAEAQAAAEEAKAVQRLADKIDAGGASAYLLAKALKGIAAPAPQPVAIQRPRDWLDYLDGVTRFVGTAGNIAVPIVTVRESNKTARAGYDRDVRVEEARQAGESARIATVGQIASDVASRPPNVTNTYTMNGQGVLGSGTYTGPVTTNRDCSGGSAGNGGGTTTGAAGGPANGGSC